MSGPQKTRLSSVGTQSQIWVALTEWPVRPIPACTAPIGGVAGLAVAGRVRAGRAGFVRGPICGPWRAFHARALPCPWRGFCGPCGLSGGPCWAFPCHRAAIVAQFRAVRAFRGPCGRLRVSFNAGGCGASLSLLSHHSGPTKRHLRGHLSGPHARPNERASHWRQIEPRSGAGCHPVHIMT